MKEKSYLNKPYDPEILERSLPKYLEDDIKALKKGYEEKTLEEDYKRYCEMIGDLSNEELNRRYKKYFLQDIA